MLKHRHHSRLKALRKEIGLTQADLAARSGVSYPYLLAVETGQRELSLSLAESIACATGVGPLWLLGTEGKASHPLTPTGGSYTRENFLSAFGKSEPLAEIDPNDEDSAETLRQSHQLTALMRAARRKRRFPVAAYFFRKMVSDTTRKLELDRIYRKELEHLRGPSARERREVAQRPPSDFRPPRRAFDLDE